MGVGVIHRRQSAVGSCSHNASVGPAIDWPRPNLAKTIQGRRLAPRMNLSENNQPNGHDPHWLVLRAAAFGAVALQLVSALLSLILALVAHAMPNVVETLVLISWLAGACAAVLDIVVTVRGGSMVWGCLPIVALILGAAGFYAMLACCFSLGWRS
jgi:hypothetical protein